MTILGFRKCLPKNCTNILLIIYIFCKFILVYECVEMLYLLNLAKKPPEPVEVIIERVLTSDVKKITQRDFFFAWKDFQETELWKIRFPEREEIYGIMSLSYFPSEYRIEINLIASRSDQVGPSKQYQRIAGTLIAWACRLAVKEYGYKACVSLTPKTKLVEHYQKAYGMLSAGRQLFVEGFSLYKLIQTYVDHEP